MDDCLRYPHRDCSASCRGKFKALYPTEQIEGVIASQTVQLDRRSSRECERLFEVFTSRSFDSLWREVWTLVLGRALFNCSSGLSTRIQI